MCCGHLQSLKSLVAVLIQVVANVPRILHFQHFQQFFDTTYKVGKNMVGPNPLSILTVNPQFAQLQINVSKVVTKAFLKASDYAKVRLIVSEWTLVWSVLVFWNLHVNHSLKKPCFGMNTMFYSLLMQIAIWYCGLHHLIKTLYIAETFRSRRASQVARNWNLFGDSVHAISWVFLPDAIASLTCFGDTLGNLGSWFGKHEQTFDTHKDVYEFSKSWDSVTYERSEHDIGQFRKVWCRFCTAPHRLSPPEALSPSACTKKLCVEWLIIPCSFVIRYRSSMQW